MRNRNGFSGYLSWVAIGLAACSVMSLVGCSSSTDSTDSASLEGAEAPVVVVAPDDWEPTMPAEEDILADRILRRAHDDLLVDATERNLRAREIASALSRIRKACPILEDEEVGVRMSYVFGVLLLGLDPQLYEAVASLVDDRAGAVTLETGYADFDSLNESLGLSVVVDLFSFSQTVTFYFSEYLNIPAAADAYEMVEGIEFAESNAYLGDGSDIDAVKSEELLYVVARRAWGDCPSGCINEELYFFVDDGAAVEMVDSQRALQEAEFSKLVMNRGWQMRSFEGC